MPPPTTTSGVNTKYTTEFQFFLDSMEPEMIIDYKTNNGVWEYYNVHNIKRWCNEFEISPIEGEL